MPELPEVETIVRGLARTVLAKKIEKVLTFLPALFSGKISLGILQGDSFKKFDRHGKFINIT
jgi:formamidopyrimidine-DNA glycosylase